MLIATNPHASHLIYMHAMHGSMEMPTRDEHNFLRCCEGSQCTLQLLSTKGAGADRSGMNWLCMLRVVNL